MPVASISLYIWIAVSGVFSSWVTAETKSERCCASAIVIESIRHTATRARMTTSPVTAETSTRGVVAALASGSRWSATTADIAVKGSAKACR